MYKIGYWKGKKTREVENEKVKVGKIRLRIENYVNKSCVTKMFNENIRWDSKDYIRETSWLIVYLIEEVVVEQYSGNYI